MLLLIALMSPLVVGAAGLGRLSVMSVQDNRLGLKSTSLR